MRIPLIVLLLLFILQFHMLQLSHSKSIVGKLPGFSGQLPFALQTGYIGVGENEEVQLFYYFVKSERNPQRDPLLLYLTGPLNFKYGNANRSEVKLELNPYSWTKTANIIFIDLPVGTGFSYAKTSKSSRSSDSLVVTHAYDFIRKWLLDHPTFLSNPLYITGISYMGIIIPNVVSRIYDGNDGFLIVNPLTDKFIDFNSRVEFAYRSALIDDEIYESAKENCGGKYVYLDPNNTMCLNSLQRVNEESIYLYSNIWANTKAVRQALHIHEGTVDNWLFTNMSIRALYGKNDTIYYSYNIFSSLASHKQLLTKNCRALIINGDHDMTFPYMGTRQWIDLLDLKTKISWKPWFVRTQVAGYFKTYSKAKYSLKYATIKDGGHAVALYKPEESMMMVETWLDSHTNSIKS
ncbi:Peptidase S10, serine carboxypeptidase [Cynara cardunculus var. scolymus]|uniref:Peptidase S10, serine carboxypeptidase n=1 Tax=Cynara cardunculus var. scolymus TaxID=59895 RepID=A0A103XUV8_CYNCS|nr:Peptidase S10, serine carboxypeptidase [Cynara cardunculus var. scolymus]